jgi:hypothetical protein
VHQRVASDVKCIRTALERVDGGSDIFCPTDFKSDRLKSEGVGRRFNFGHFQFGAPIINIAHDRHPAKRRHYFKE